MMQRRDNWYRLVVTIGVLIPLVAPRGASARGDLLGVVVGGVTETVNQVTAPVTETVEQVTAPVTETVEQPVAPEASASPTTTTGGVIPVVQPVVKVVAPIIPIVIASVVEVVAPIIPIVIAPVVEVVAPVIPVIVIPTPEVPVIVIPTPEVPVVVIPTPETPAVGELKPGTGSVLEQLLQSDLVGNPIAPGVAGSDNSTNSSVNVIASTTTNTEVNTLKQLSLHVPAWTSSRACRGISAHSRSLDKLGMKRNWGKHFVWQSL